MSKDNNLEKIVKEPDKHPAKANLIQKAKKTYCKAYDCVKPLIMPYILTVRQPESIVYALGDMVKDLRLLPGDIKRYLSTSPKDSDNIEKLVKEYKIPDNITSHALIVSEVAAWAGSYGGACLSGNVVSHSYAQAIGGGLIGSEGATAAAFFLTLSMVNSVFYFRHRKKAGKAAHLERVLAKETAKTAAYALPAGMLSIIVADIGISAGCVYAGVQPEWAATIGAFFGSLVYLGSAKVSIAHSNRKHK